MLKEFIEKYCPEITKKIEENKNTPTLEARVAALEEAMLEQILMGGFNND